MSLHASLWQMSVKHSQWAVVSLSIIWGMNIFNIWTRLWMWDGKVSPVTWSKHIWASLILTAAFIRHAGWCSGIFLYFPIICAFFTLFVALSLLFSFFPLPYFESLCAGLGSEVGAPQTLEGYSCLQNIVIHLVMLGHCQRRFVIKARVQWEGTKGHWGPRWHPDMKGARCFNED